MFQTNTDQIYDEMTNKGKTKDNFDDKHLSTVRTHDRYSKKQQGNEYQEVQKNTELSYEEVAIEGKPKDIDSVDYKQLSTVGIRERYGKTQQDNKYQEAQTSTPQYFEEVT